MNITQSPEPRTQRLASIDALRGLDMFWIMGGGNVATALASASGLKSLEWVPQQLEHVPWEGFRFIDLIFPLFLFLIGTSIPFALDKRRIRGDSSLSIYGHILRRTLILIVLGMMVNGNLLTLDPAKFQLTYSVLQMLALGYLFASVLYLNLGNRGQLAATAGLIVGYWALLAFVPVPGHAPGVIAPGANVGDWLNDRLLGDFQGQWRFGWILGIMGHAATAMLGVYAGRLLGSSRSPHVKAAWLASLGAAGLAIGYLWSGWAVADLERLGVRSGLSQWPVWCPIIKNRWTSSYVLFAGGWSFLLLAVTYLMVDVWGWRRWAFPFLVIGANSIFAYMAMQLANPAFRHLAETFLGGLRRFPSIAPWHEAIFRAGTMGVLWLCLFYMYKNKTFIRA